MHIPKTAIERIRAMPMSRVEMFGANGKRLYMAYRGRGRAYVSIFKSLESYLRREPAIATQIVSLRKRRAL